MRLALGVSGNGHGVWGSVRRSVSVDDPIALRAGASGVHREH